MSASRLGLFLALSAALHATVLLTLTHAPPAAQWQAGPVSLRLALVTPGKQDSSAAPSVEPQQADTAPRRVAARQADIPAKPLRERRAIQPDSSQRAAAAVQPAAAPEAARGKESPPTMQAARLEQYLRDRLQEALLPHFNYPLLARRRGWEGVVRVGVRIEANGRLTHLHLVEASPYAVLNTAAVQSLAQLARLPAVDSWLQGSHVDLVLPIEYRLLEG